VTSSAALEAAQQTSRFLSARHFYADLNSVSPALKQQIAAVVDASGARFVEAAVMAPVAPYGHRVHGERRAREMEEVSETLRSIGVEPIMSEAAARRQDWSARLDLAARFGPEGPKSYREVLKLL